MAGALDESGWSGLMFEAESLTNAKAEASSCVFAGSTMSRDAELLEWARDTIPDGRTDACARNAGDLFKGRAGRLLS